MKINEVMAQAKSAEAKRNPPEKSEIAGDQWTISLPKTRIHTLDQLVEYCKIDLKIWEVERFICNKWDVGMKPVATTEHVPREKDGVKVPHFVRYEKDPIVVALYQVKAYLRKKKNIVAALDEINELRKKARGYAPKYPVFKKSEEVSGNLVEFAPTEIHFGALIWGRETGNADYDLPLARKAWEASFVHLMRRTDGFEPDRALIVLGSDQQNADNRSGTTERGTAQTMDSRYQKVFEVSRDCSIWAVDALLQKYKAVDVVMVPGNHDPLSTWHLGDSLAAWYRRCTSVKVDNEPRFRKYYEYGANMLLFTHGHAGKLEDYGKTMAAEQPQMWGRTKWREAHTGDKHHRRTIELAGATVRIIPSLRPPCAWSSENNYVGNIRAAEAYVWNRAEGLIGTGVYSILDKS